MNKPEQWRPVSLEKESAKINTSSPDKNLKDENEYYGWDPNAKYIADMESTLGKKLEDMEIISLEGATKKCLEFNEENVALLARGNIYTKSVNVDRDFMISLGYPIKEHGDGWFIMPKMESLPEEEMSPEKALSICQTIYDQIQPKDVAHGDIRRSNIMIHEENPLVIDFSRACRIDIDQVTPQRYRLLKGSNITQLIFLYCELTGIENINNAPEQPFAFFYKELNRAKKEGTEKTGDRVE